jgi:hypothetical protein
MSTFSWLVIGFLAIAYLVNWVSSLRCERHGGFGRCRICEQEAAEKAKAEAEARVEAERRWRDIEDTYRSMDASLRDELTAIVKKRAEREHLVIRAGDLETAVVRIYRNPKQLTALVGEFLREQGTSPEH